MTRFPEGFRWGTATASYQIEGAVDEDGREPSIWDVFSHTPGTIASGDTGDTACDHYHRWREDVQHLQLLGVDTYRFSISWSRVLRADGSVNRAGLDFYSELVDALLAAGVRPWITLYHWDLPASLDGGWLSRSTAERFPDYALAVHRVLGDRVRTWTTLNEPWCSAFLGYAAGVHAPGVRDPRSAFVAAHHLMLAHGLGVQALRAADSGAELGITLNFTPVFPATPADADVARRVDGTANRLFVEAICRGAYPADIVRDAGELWPAEAVRDGDLEIVAQPIDVLGVNYYTTHLVGGGGSNPAPADVLGGDVREVSRGLPRTDMGWEVDPAGLSGLLTRLHDDYTGPAGVGLVVTENGAAYPDQPGEDGVIHDTDRIGYLHAHLAAVQDAIAAGADVRGYFLWSLMDNFEWAEGYAKRFGIIRVEPGSLDRVWKDSAHWFTRVVRENALPTP